MNKPPQFQSRASGRKGPMEADSWREANDLAFRRKVAASRHKRAALKNFELSIPDGPLVAKMKAAGK